MKKAKKVFSYTLSGLAIIYGLALIFPQTLFSNTIGYKNFTVYYHSDTMDIQKLKTVLDESTSLLSESEVFNIEKQQKIFLCNSFAEFAFFAPRSRKSFAVNYPLIQNIFLSESNLSKNEIHRNASENNRRTLSDVIAHETTHSLLEDKLGILKYKLLPIWKNEGYCDYVAQESSYDEKLGWSKICKNPKEETSLSFTYFKYKTYVTYLLEKENISLDTLLLKEFKIGNVSIKSREVFCSGFSK